MGYCMTHCNIFVFFFRFLYIPFLYLLEFNFLHQTDLKSLMEDVAFIFLALCLRGLATQFWVFVTVSTTGLCLFLWEVFLLRGYRLLVLFILSLLFLLIILDKIRNVFLVCCIIVQGILPCIFI